MANPAIKSIAVLGGGVTGLTAAHRLARRGHRVRLFEAADRVGGVVRSERRGDWLIEAGPNTMFGGAPTDTALLRELGLEPERMPVSAEANQRYIVRGGRLVAMPSSPTTFLTSRLFSVTAKLRGAAEFFARRRTRHADLSIAEFVRDRFGQEIVDYGLSPIINGIFAGDPQKLSTRHAFAKLWELEQTRGSLVRAQLAAARAPRERRGVGLMSFRDGMQMLTDALAARLPVGAVSLRARIEAVLPGAPWSVVWADGNATRTEQFDAVIAALPAPALAQLRFGTLGERPLAALDAIEHVPMSMVFLGYRREQVAHPLDAFGVLVPAVEKRAMLSVLFSSTLFPGRAPPGHVALTVTTGGACQPEIARLPTDRLLAAIVPELEQLLGVTGAPVTQHHAFWPKAIPQYNVGYESHFETMAAAERAHPGFFLGGHARDGGALPACIAAGEKLAARIE